MNFIYGEKWESLVYSLLSQYGSGETVGFMEKQEEKKWQVYLCSTFVKYIPMDLKQ